MMIDAAVLSSGSFETFLHALRKVKKNVLFVPMLSVGLPALSAGQSQLRIREDADYAAVVQALSSTAETLARDHGANLIVFKEFSLREATRLESLEQYGYRRADSIPTNLLPGTFASFDEYIASMRANYRRMVKCSILRGKRRGLKVKHTTGSEHRHDVFDKHLYALYLQVIRRSATKFEVLPIQFFQQLLQNFGHDSVLSVAELGQTRVGFALSLVTRQSATCIYVGLDYARNEEADVYFNLMCGHLGTLFHRGITSLNFGQNADVFKSRLGFIQESRHIFVKGYGIWSGILRLFGRWLLPQAEFLPARNVFRVETGAQGVQTGKLR